MYGDANPLTVLLDPDVGGSPFEFECLPLVGPLHLELDRDNRSVTVELRLFFGLSNLGYPGGIIFKGGQEFRFAPELSRRAGIHIGIRKYRC